jgi:N-acetylneuraminic acid mutarotase
MAQGGTSYINKYQVSSKLWTQLPNVPCFFYGNIVHTGSDLYVVCGHNSKKLYRYDPGNTAWKKLADAPDTISNAGNQGAVYDGTGAIYVLRGANTYQLYKYTLGENDDGTWATESAAIPLAIGSANAAPVWGHP